MGFLSAPAVGPPFSPDDARYTRVEEKYLETPSRIPLSQISGDARVVSFRYLLNFLEYGLLTAC